MCPVVRIANSQAIQNTSPAKDLFHPSVVGSAGNPLNTAGLYLTPEILSGDL